MCIYTKLSQSFMWPVLKTTLFHNDNSEKTLIQLYVNQSFDSVTSCLFSLLVQVINLIFYLILSFLLILKKSNHLKLNLSHFKGQCK